MKKHTDKLDFLVSTWVTFDLKNELYQIAYREKTSVSDIARRLLEKGVSDYKEVSVNGN